jgi:hypothetical protein
MRKMKTRIHGSVALTAGLALGIAVLGATAQAADGSPADKAPAHASAASGQQRVADTTRKLENAFNEQFVHGKIDREALSGPISEVVEAMPEAARPKVKDHIELILKTGEQLASQMTPEQRAAAAEPPPAEKVGTTQQAQIAAWGWPGAAGWGGYGAFGFPGMFGLGAGLGWGGYGTTGLYGAGYGLGYGTTGLYGTGYGLGGYGLGYGGLGYGLGWGGLGMGGWYW